MDKPVIKKARVFSPDQSQNQPVIPENNNKLTRLLYSVVVDMPRENKITSNLLKYL